MINFSHNPQYTYQRDFNHLIIAKRKPYATCQLLQQFIADPDGLLAKHGQVIKGCGREKRTVFRVTHGAQDWVVKRYNIKSIRHGLKVVWIGTRLFNCWKYNNVVEQLGVNVIPPVALIERRLGPFHGVGYFISEYHPGISGMTFFNDTRYQHQWATALQSVFTGINKLHHHGLVHGDFQWGNVLIHEDKAIMLDFDAMQAYPPTSEHCQREAQNDIANFFITVDEGNYAEEITKLITTNKMTTSTVSPRNDKQSQVVAV